MFVESIVLQLVLQAVFGIICAVVASGRARSGVGWFFIGAFFGCLGLIVLLVIPDLRIEQERRSRMLSQNRRIREQVRKDRVVADARSVDHDRRLQAHDRALGVDTAPPRPEFLASDQSQPPWQVAGPSAASTDPTSQPLPDLAETGSPPPAAAESSADHEARAWYFADHEGRQGPVSLPILRTLWEQGTVTQETYVWADGMADWAPVARVAGLQDALDVA